MCQLSSWTYIIHLTRVSGAWSHKPEITSSNTAVGNLIAEGIVFPDTRKGFDANFVKFVLFMKTRIVYHFYRFITLKINGQKLSSLLQMKRVEERNYNQHMID